jgi:hypothetical protein
MSASLFALRRGQRRLLAMELLKLEEDMQAATEGGRMRDPFAWARLKLRQRRLDAYFQVDQSSVITKAISACALQKRAGSEDERTRMSRY